MTIDIANKRARVILKQLFSAGLHAADPAAAIQRTLKVRGKMLWVGKRRYSLKAFRRVCVVGAGKASGRMAQAVERQLGRNVTDGLVVVKDGHRCPTQTIQIVEARHPIPDRRGVRAATGILKLVQSLHANDLLLVLISGGASSLLPLPVPGLSLSDKQKTTDLLLRSGATIEEINAVRKHVSAIKGGSLAASTQAAVVSLILSDVLGDDLGTIGSGPTAADPTTFDDVKCILEKYQLWQCVPASVRDHVKLGMGGAIPETPKPGASIFSKVQNEIIGNNRLAISQLSKQARELGIRPLVLTTMLQGEAKEAGKMVGAMAQEIHRSGQPLKRPACLIFGGEPTVTVTGKGPGGRAQELVLSAARILAGLPNVYVAGIGTDGTDGPTDAAGAVVDGGTWHRAQRQGRDPDRALTNHESYQFFHKAGGHIVTGPTGTNVNDVYVLLAL